MNEVIKLNSLTKDYGMGRGIFDVDLTINQGEMVGFVPKTFVLEIAKWAATLVFCCTMPPRKSRWLLRMRLEISRGLFTKIRN